MKTVAIVISPMYKSGSLELMFSKEEAVSLKQLKKHLDNYDKYFIIPENANIKKDILSKMLSIKLPKNLKFVRFPNKYLGTVKNHNAHLLSKEFYQKFKQYKYILLYHTDALVFSDQLLDWCKKDYSYCAAPWLKSRLGIFTYKKGAASNVGGNGGFSIRKVQSFLQVLGRVERLAKRKTDNPKVRKLWFWLAVITGRSHGIWLNAPISNYPFNEDGFWSLEAAKYLDSFKVTTFSEGLKFAFEKFPEKCLELNNGNLPFGCHGWNKYGKRFWSKFLH